MSDTATATASRFPPMRWLRGLYDWTLRLAGHPRAALALFGIAFLESTVFPVPPDVLLIAMVLARRERWLAYTLIATAGTILGAMLAYGIGYFAFEWAGRPILEFYGHYDVYLLIQQQTNQYGFLAVVTAAFTPLPDKVFSLAFGALKLDFLSFTIASLIGRLARYLIVAALLYAFGPPIKRFIERYLGPLTLAFAVLLIGGFLLIGTVLQRHRPDAAVVAPPSVPEVTASPVPEVTASPVPGGTASPVPGGAAPTPTP